MSFQAITLEDCMFLKYRYNLDTVIQNGEVIGFEKKDNVGPVSVCFFFSDRSKKPY